jgi:hypothetical protein
MTQRILVVPTAPIPDAVIRSRLRDIADGDVEIKVTAPASKIGKLDWLTNAEDDARADAADRAEQVADALPGDPVEAEVGDTNPMQAIEDALRTFPADEVIVVTRPDDQAEWLEKGVGPNAKHSFRLPVRHLVIPDDTA